MDGGRIPARRLLLFIDLLITLGIIQLGGSWRSSYFAYTVTTIMLFTIFEGTRGAYVSATVLALAGFIKDPSGGLPSFKIFFIDDLDMRVGAVFFYFGTGVIYGYFHTLLQRLEMLSQAKIEETRKRAAMEEKARMALELHDGAKQMVNAMLLKMNPVVKRIQSSRDETSNEVRWLWRGMNYLKCEFDQVMDALKEGSEREDSQKHDNIVPLIEEEAKLAEVMTGFTWEVSVESQEIRRSPRFHLPLRRFLSEALMNAWKHSGVASGTITLKATKDKAVLTISDQGQGFNYADGKDMKTTGLKSLKYRAKELNGDLLIETAPRKGCRLVLTFPVFLQSRPIHAEGASEGISKKLPGHP